MTLATISRRSVCGFTLLEVLLATVLSSVLLATLWALFGMYGRLLDQGQTSVTRSQLVRGLSQQLIDDLRGAIQDVADPSVSATGPARRFGLYGTSQSLQFDVMQAAGEPLPQVQSAELGPTTDEQTLGSEAWELRTVRYAFETHQFDENQALLNRGGLVRQELDFQTPNAPGTASGPTETGDELSLGDAAAVEGDGSETGLPPIDMAAATDDPTSTWVPEVASVQFRYFDGLVWTSAWNSLQQRSLPVAVEMTVQVLSAEEIAKQQAQGAEFALDDAEMPDPAVSAVIAPAGNVYRVVVDLPCAAMHRATRALAALDTEMFDALDEPDADQPMADDALPAMPDELLNDDGNATPVIQLPTGAPPPNTSRGQVPHGPRYVPPPSDLETRPYSGFDRPFRVMP